NQSYYIATALGGGTTGNYTLHATLAQQETEPNDTLSVASEYYAYRVPLAGTLTSGDVDYFRLRDDLYFYSAHILTARVHAAFDVRLSVLDPSGTVVGQGSGSAAANRDAEVTLVVPLYSLLYLKVEGADGGTGAYALTASSGPSAREGTGSQAAAITSP